LKRAKIRLKQLFAKWERKLILVKVFAKIRRDWRLEKLLNLRGKAN